MEGRGNASKENSFRVKTDALARTYGDFSIQNRKSRDKREEIKSPLIVRDRFSVAEAIDNSRNKEIGSEVSIRMPSLERIEDMKRIKYAPYNSFLKSSVILDKPYRIAKIPPRASSRKDLPQ